MDFINYTGYKLRTDVESILRKNLYPESYWEHGAGFLNFEVDSMPAEDGTWYLLVCHVSMRRRSIVDISLITLESDGITFCESDEDVFEQKEEGMKEAERILGMIAYL